MATEPLAQIGQTNVQAIEPAPHWRLGTRIAFRFAFTYLVLYIFPFPLGTLPYTDYPAEKYQALWDKIVPWVRKHVLLLSYASSLPSPAAGTGRMITFRCCVSFVPAVLATVVWSLVDRKRTN